MKTLAKGLALTALIIVLLTLSGDTIKAANGDCSDVIDDLEFAIDNCTEINSNWACYGSDDTVATPEELRFYEPGHRQSIAEVEEINTVDESGVAFMYLWKEGEKYPVTVVLYGGAKTSPQDGAFVLSVDDNDPICEDSPPAMVAFTETGESGNITVNGVSIELKSTVIMSIPVADSMIIANAGGQVVSNISGESQELSEGYQSLVTGVGADNPTITGSPTLSEISDSPVAQYLVETLGKVYDPNKDPDSPIPACGGEIEMGTTISDTIHTPGQECLFTFSASENDVVTISLDTGDQSELDPYLDLRGPDLALITSNNDRSGASAESMICNQTLLVGGEYTIVVRSNRNQSEGPFNLSLGGESDCLTPPCFCKVTAPYGLNLREGPGIQFPRIRRALPQGLIFEPLQCVEDRQWYRANVEEFNATGWIRANTDFVECEPCIKCRMQTPQGQVTMKAQPASVFEPGGIVQATVSLENTSESALQLEALTFRWIGNVTANPKRTVDTVNVELKSGEIHTHRRPIQVDGIGGELVTISVTAALKDEDGNDAEPNFAEATLEILDRPEIGIGVVSIPNCINKCGLAEFTVTVENKGREALHDVTLTETACEVQSPLQPGAFDVCRFDKVICGEEGDTQYVNLGVSVKDAAKNDMQEDFWTPVKICPKPVCEKCGPFGPP